MANKRILIITAPRTSRDTLINRLDECWSKIDFHVSYISDLDKKPEADLVLSKCAGAIDKSTEVLREILDASRSDIDLVKFRHPALTGKMLKF